MQNVSEAIYDNLRYLRRYARALTGSQKSGDLYVRLCLETLLEDPRRMPSSDHVRLDLFRLFHDIRRRAGVREYEGIPNDSAKVGELSVESRLQALPPIEREVLLLHALEAFSLSDIAVILGISLDETERLLDLAWADVNSQIATNVMIIEDEPVIALDIAGLIAEIGHTVSGVAASHADAVQLARDTKPGLILADIDLGPGGSGLDAVQEILKIGSVPVIFVTAYPERLLTGERPEPTYLVTKPFEPETLKVTISQALSMPVQHTVSKVS